MFCLAFTTATAWAQDPLPAYLSQITITNLIEVASNLVTRYGPRRADSYDHFLDGSCTWSGVPYTNTTIELSAAYARSLFEAMGYSPTMENVPDDAGSYGHNVYVTKTGSVYPNVYIEFGGHMDTQPGTPGGCDNASGSTSIIELARVLKDYPNRYSMRFALWVAEEISVPGPGCYYHVQQALARGEKIKAGLNIDSTGWPDAPGPDGTPNYKVELWYDDAESSRICDLVDNARTQYNVSIGIRKNPARGTSDERGYWYNGQTAVSSVGGGPEYAPNYHGCGDTVTNVDFTNVFRALQLNLAAGLKLDAEVLPPSITLALSPSSVPADGTSTSTATATVRDESGNLLVGETVVFTTSGDVTLGSVTDRGDGTYQVSVTASTTPGEEIITAMDSGGSATASLSETTYCSGSCFADTAPADFTAGTLTNGTYVAQTYDGEVILAPTLGAEFIGKALPPAGWTLTPYYCAEGTATVQDGQISLNCTLLASSIAYGPGHSLEFQATYVAGNPYQGAGFWRYFTSPWRGLDLGADGDALLANTSLGTPVPVPGNPIGSPHRYRIDWASSNCTFWVDGTKVATQPGTAGGETMKVILADYAWNTSDTQNFRVDWVRLTPYAASGMFYSRVCDAGQLVTWHTLAWSADTPAETSLALSYRTGNTPTPDGTWTSFAPVSASGGAVTSNARYLMYAARLATSNTTQTPVLKDVTVSYLPYAPPAIVTQPVSVAVVPGCDATFSVSAQGIEPLSYQWAFDGTNLVAATNTSLALTNVQPSGFGNYRVIVANLSGSVTSSPAVLALGHPPVAGADTIYRFAAGGFRVNAGVLMANDTDADGDLLSIFGVNSSSSAGGTVGLTNNRIYYAPPADWTNGSPFDTFTYVVSDGHCGTSVGTVTVQVRPDNPQPVTFAVANPGDGTVRLTFDGIPGYTYRLEYTEDLANPNWQTLAGQAADGFGVCQLVDGSLTNTAMRFYRAAWP